MYYTRSVQEIREIKIAAAADRAQISKMSLLFQSPEPDLLLLSKVLR